MSFLGKYWNPTDFCEQELATEYEALWIEAAQLAKKSVSETGHLDADSGATEKKP